MPDSKGLKRPPGDSGLGELPPVKACRINAVDTNLKKCWWCMHPIQVSANPLQPIAIKERDGPEYYQHNPKFYHYNCYEAVLQIYGPDSV